ncbi:MAG TPA: hypothetical protein VGB85_18350 [Nannocystis sp.]
MSRSIARLWPVVLGIATLAAMYMNWRGDPFDPTLEGTARYGHNHEGALSQIASLVLAELVVLYLVLAPGSAARSIGRAIAALLLFAPWTLFSLLLTMHAGGIAALHALWLMAVDLGIVVVLVARCVKRRQ